MDSVVPGKPGLKVSHPWLAVVWAYPDDKTLTMSSLPSDRELNRPCPGRGQAAKLLEVVHDQLVYSSGTLDPRTYRSGEASGENGAATGRAQSMLAPCGVLSICSDSNTAGR